MVQRKYLEVVAQRGPIHVRKINERSEKRRENQKRKREKALKRVRKGRWKGTGVEDMAGRELLQSVLRGCNGIYGG